MTAPLSADPRVDAALRRILERALPEVLRSWMPFRPRLIFLGGSAALGEAVGWDGGAGTLLLSDLDLSVVTEARVPPAAREDLARWCASADGPGAGFAGGRDVVTVGAYELARLARETPTPGVCDFARHARVLWGDGRLLGGFRAPAPERLDGYEALRLAGNRSLELLRVEPPPPRMPLPARPQRAGVRDDPGAPDGPAAPDGPIALEGPLAPAKLSEAGEGALPRARAFFTLAKACAGLWTSALLFRGAYVSGWGRREALLDAPAASAIAPAVREGAELWRAFLRAPSEGTLPAAGARLPSFRRGLAAWLASEAPSGAGADGWIRPFLSEPNSVRDWARAWRRPSPPRIGRRCLLGALRYGTGDTPPARSRAAAVLYWWVLPEAPDAGWDGEGGDDAAAAGNGAWETAARRLLGSAPAPGGGCRLRLVRLLESAKQG